MLSFSMMPMSAFAEEAGTVTEQEAQKGENTAEVSATGGDTVEVSTNGEDVSDGNAVAKDAAVQAAQDGEHTHPICGVECSHEKDGGAEHDAQTWHPVSQLIDNMAAGYYYLTQNIEIDNTWKPVNGVYLCLNGHSITMNADGTAVITIESGVTFTLYDCNDSNTGNGKITHGTKDETAGTKYTGSGVEVNGGTFYMYGGTISDNTRTDGAAGVYVKEGSFFTMAGGIISGNKVTRNDYGGGGVYLAGNATFTMKDGEISGNTAGYGGGVAVIPSNGGAVFNMTGGKITDNKATGSGGGGVYVQPGDNSINSINVAGNVKIEKNTDKDGKSNNVYLDKRNSAFATITVTGKLDDEAHIGVTTKSAPTEDSPVTLATAGEGYTLTADDADRFSSDVNYYPVFTDNVVKLYSTKPHKHLICGETCNHTGDEKHTENLTWKGISNLTEITENGCYYLKDNVTVSPTWECNYNVKLCLNGKTITGTSGTAIRVENSLDITDCGGNDNGKGKITLSDGTKGHGISVGNGGELALWNGDITGITYNGDGSGVYVAYKGKFTMYGGAITGNTSTSYGGGVYVAGDGTFIMTGGAITGNTSTSHGGGVYVNNTGTFTMTGGEITGNNTTVSEKLGLYAGGVYVNRTGSFIISGDAQITNNYWNGTLDDTNKYVNGTDSNVLLYGAGGTLATITIGENGLKPEARIGVSRNADSFDESNKAKIATGAKDTSLNYAAIFTSDDPQYVITNDQGTLYLGVHQHNWRYTQSAEDEKTINATCTATGCPAADGKGGSVTIAAPDKLTYDGSAKAATVSASTDWMGEAVGEISITYKDEAGNKSSTAPTNAGKYTASITLGGATASVDYTIAKAVPKASDFNFIAPDSLTYDGKAKTVTVAARFGIKGMGSITVKYYQGEKEVQEPKNAGDYKVKINVAEGDNYTAADGLTSEEWKFTIAHNNTQPTVEWSGNTTYTYTGGQITPEVTVKVGDTTLVKDTDYTIEYGNNITAGENAGSVTIKAATTGNYGFTDVIKNFDIEKAKQTLSFEKDAVNTTYGKTFTNTLTHSKGDGKITYKSSEPTVATVDNSGNVTIVGVGTATITATAAATTNYKEGTATYKLTVDKAEIRIKSAVVMWKYYDGSKNAQVSSVSFVDEEDNELSDVMSGRDYNATGAFRDENAGGQRVDVTVELLNDFAKKYVLEDKTYVAYANIEPKPIRIESATAEDRDYKKDDRSVKTDITFKDNEDKSVDLKEGTDYTVSGEMTDANAGTNKAVTVTVTLKDSAERNYRFSDTEAGTATTTVNIKQVTPVITVAESEQTIMKNGVAVDISQWASTNNTDDRTLIYELVGTPEGITLEGNKLTAANKAATVGTFNIKVTATETTNFTAPTEKTITVKVTDKADADVHITGETADKTYGDENFTLTATKTAPDGGAWSWSSTDSAILEITSGADTDTPTIKVKKVGTAILTVTYISDDYYGSADVTITVAAKAVTADMIGNIPAQEYTGNDIKPTPEVTDGTTKLTSGEDFEYSYSNNRDVGTATLTITGNGNYTGKVEQKFTISPKSIDGAVIELANKSFAYIGSEQTVNITSVTLKGWTNTINYEVVSGNKATDAGEITLTIEGRGNYTGTATTTWKITKIDPELADFVVTPEDLTTALTYDGKAKTVNVKEKDGINGMGEITVKYNGNTQAPTNAGSYEVTFDVADGTNYNAQTFDIGTLTINKAAAPERNDIEAGYKYTLTGEKTVKLAGLVADATGYTLGEIAGDTDIISNHSVDANGVLKFTLTGKGKINDTVTLPVTITSVNYEDTTVKVVITLKAKDDQAALSITGDNTVVYGKTLTLGTTGGSGTGKVTYSIDEANSTGEATIDTNGVLTPTKVGKVTIIATKAGDADYNEATSAAFVITITKAGSTGEPKYTVITTDGKTLADAGLTLTGSTLNPAEGTLKWVDEAGNELPADTKVEVNKTYKWCFTPADTNYDILTGEMVLYPVYQILDGANSSWTQNADGSGSIKIRGNGEISKFVNVKVDGVIVDPANYTVTEGSTIVEFKPEYLKTLSEGTHTFEMFWKDGSASTSFTVAKNTADDDDDNDDNGGSVNTAGSSDNTAQTLTKSPKTGDASGLWIALFAASAAGLAVMLVVRRKN